MLLARGHALSLLALDAQGRSAAPAVALPDSEALPASGGGELSADGRFLALSTPLGLAIRDRRSGATRLIALPEGAQPITDLALSPSGARIALLHGGALFVGVPAQPAPAPAPTGAEPLNLIERHSLVTKEIPQLKPRILKILHKRHARALHASEIRGRLGIERTRHEEVLLFLSQLAEQGLIARLSGDRFQHKEPAPAASPAHAQREHGGAREHDDGARAAAIRARRRRAASSMARSPSTCAASASS